MVGMVVQNEQVEMVMVTLLEFRKNVSTAV
jgi:hypothetical protein